jgi:precorrin-6B methylase 2
MATKNSAKSKLDIPYVPSTDEKVALMLELAAPKKGMRAADLGSGDGRIVIALAQQGVRVDGFELNPDRARLSQKNVVDSGMEELAQIHEQSFWDVDLSPYDIIMLYGITSMMGRLEEKLQNELAPGAKVVSNIFTFPTWRYVIERSGIYLYKR